MKKIILFAYLFVALVAILAAPTKSYAMAPSGGWKLCGGEEGGNEVTCVCVPDEGGDPDGCGDD